LRPRRLLETKEPVTCEGASRREREEKLERMMATNGMVNLIERHRAQVRGSTGRRSKA
jgi:hypothetical protein